MMSRRIALSIRQPYAELILRGTKKIEYRTKPTDKRCRVYVYAALSPGPRREWGKARIKYESLPTGLIVGSVRITGCSGVAEDYEWHLAAPRRLKRLLKPKGNPQPSWFHPFPD
jgi:predicted transcriptional regulator